MSAKRTATAEVIPDQTARAAVDEVQKPSEEPAAVALRERFAAFHAGASTRTAITAEDRADLAAIDSLSAEYQSIAHDAWFRMEWGTTKTTPNIIASLGSMITEYRLDCIDEEEIPLVSGRKKMLPTVESPTLRRVLVRDGDAILQRIEECVAAGFARIKRAKEMEQQFTENVRLWMTTQPLVRRLVATLSATSDYAPNSLATRHGLLQSIRATQARIVHGAELAGGTPPEPLFAHDWRRWLPIAEAILAETDAPQEGVTA